MDTLRVQAIKLWWYAVDIPDNAGLGGRLAEIAAEKGAAAEALGRPGVYAFEGSHDSRPAGGILYIGQVGADDEKTKKNGVCRSIRDRVTESFSRFAWADRAIRGEDPTTGLFADVWNLRLRWASVDDGAIEGVERLLILAHAPSFNACHVRGKLSEKAKDLLVMNAGAKGMLLPVLAGKYFDAPFWAM